MGGEKNNLKANITGFLHCGYFITHKHFRQQCICFKLQYTSILKGKTITSSNSSSSYSSSAASSSSSSSSGFFFSSPSPSDFPSSSFFSSSQNRFRPVYLISILQSDNQFTPKKLYFSKSLHPRYCRLCAPHLQNLTEVVVNCQQVLIRKIL